MAKKKTRAHAEGGTRKKRRRRSPDEIISDLQEEIRRVRDRARSRSLKQSPAVKSALSAVRSIDKGLAAAAEENNAHLRHALADARKALSGYLENQGMRLPRARMPKGPRPRRSSTADDEGSED